MGEKQRLMLNLQNAPIIVGLSALDSNSWLTIDWPDKLEYSKLKLPRKKTAEIEDKLAWIKRQYEALLKNPKTRVYAPHVVPYLAQADLHVNTKGTDFAARSDRLSRYPLNYTANLAKSLSNTFMSQGVSGNHKIGREDPGAAIKDRTRFRVISFQPLNELEAGLIGYYETSNLPWSAAFDGWSELDYDMKLRLLKRAIDKQTLDVEYELEVILEPQLLKEGLENDLFEIISMQSPTPAYGYAMPKKLNDGGMIERCFDISYELYSELYRKYPEAASLVCLWGHRQRAIVRMDAGNVLSSANLKPKRLVRLADVITEKLALIHPVIIESLKGDQEVKKGEK